MTLDIKSANVRALTPAYLHDDPEGHAMQAAVQAAVDLFLGDLKYAYDTLTNVAEMPEWMLDETASAYGILWYDYKADVSVKRKMIAARLETGRIIGTKAAMADAIKQYFGDGKVIETGNYHFEIETSNDRATGAGAASLKRIVNVLKNVRSVYDGTVKVQTAALPVEVLFEMAMYKTVSFNG